VYFLTTNVAFVFMVECIYLFFKKMQNINLQHSYFEEASQCNKWLIMQNASVNS